MRHVQERTRRPASPEPPVDALDHRRPLWLRFLTHSATIMGGVLIALVGAIYFFNFDLGKDKPPPAGALSAQQLNTLLGNGQMSKAEAADIAAANERAHIAQVKAEAVAKAKAKKVAKAKAKASARASASARAKKLRDKAVNPAGNIALGQEMNALKGWGSCWPSLKIMWDHESHWSQTADNPFSTAYGIPQALPGSKMASVGADWRTNSATQIAWGLGYIAARYGDPCQAWTFWQGHSWY